MPVSIIACPSCNTLLLKDTVQCPACRFVLDESRAGNMDVSAEQAENHRRSASEDPCPECGEMIRRGLVRCWKCGAFMRQDVAESYRRMQETTPSVIYSPLPGGGPNPHTASSHEKDWTKGKTPKSSPPSNADNAAPEAKPSEAKPAEATSTEKAEAPAAREANEAASREATESVESGDADFEEGGSESGSIQEINEEELPVAPPKRRGGEGEEDEPDESAQDDVPHSEATGGDALLRVALEEESESDRRRSRPSKGAKLAASPDALLVYCPNGHRIEVHERHRGKIGRCPRCQSRFIVPEKSAGTTKAAADERSASPKDSAAAGDGEAARPKDADAGTYGRWLQDVRLHVVTPEKVKLKPGSLENDYRLVDLGFSADEMLLVALPTKKNLFGRSSSEDIEAAREALRAHLEADKPKKDLPADHQRTFPWEKLGQVRFEQPAGEEESSFLGIPVFGKGRIAFKLPKGEDADDPTYLSLTLSEFREFSAGIAEFAGVENFGADCGVPLTDEFETLSCHYTDQPIRVLQHLDFYTVDPRLSPEVVGYRCQGCGLVISEVGRKKERIGGASGKKIARAKCPKCKGKFGNEKLYTSKQQPEDRGRPAEEDSQTSDPR